MNYQAKKQLITAFVFSCLAVFFLLSQPAVVAEESCIKAWVSGNQLLGIVSVNPLTYSKDYCIDDVHAIGYVSSPAYIDSDLDISFTSNVQIDVVADLFVMESDCEFYYEYPAEAYWGQFNGNYGGDIYGYFATNSSTMAYGTANMDFTITDDNASIAYPRGGHLCYPGSMFYRGWNSSRVAPFLEPSIVIYEKSRKDRGLTKN